MDIIAENSYEIGIGQDKLPEIKQNGIVIENEHDVSPEILQAKTVTEAINNSDSGQVWVNGYYRKDGTYVKGHWRKK